MKKSRVIGLDSFLKSMAKEVNDFWVKEQIARLVEYAINKIGEIASAIQSHGYSMDRTGNLLDSLCWVVAYNNEYKASGFYREQTANDNSYLHELFTTEIREMFPVYGHELARMFIEEHGSKSGQFAVYFAVLAPYWGYWEVGHKNVLTHQYEKFAVMAEFRDRVEKDLKPAKISFFRSRPHYTIPKMKKMYKRMSESPYAEKRHFKRWPSIKNR